VRYAKLEGVGFRFCKAPVEIRENGIICRDTVKGEDGRFTQVEGSETFYPHTGVIVSVSQGSESTLVKTTTGIETNQRGLLTVNEDGSTTREGVFAGGDAVMGERSVVEAVAIAKKVAESMDSYMKSLPADTAPDPLRRHPGVLHPDFRRSDEAGHLTLYIEKAVCHKPLRPASLSKAGLLHAAGVTERLTVRQPFLFVTFICLCQS